MSVLAVTGMLFRSCSIYNASKLAYFVYPVWTPTFGARARIFFYIYFFNLSSWLNALVARICIGPHSKQFAALAANVQLTMLVEFVGLTLKRA
jgi:hypothetical protein